MAISVGGGSRVRAQGAVLVAAVLLAAALITWILTIDRMRGMDAGPGTDLGALGWFLGVWVTMMAAMMFPSVAPMTVVVGRVSGERGSGPGALASTTTFVAGYLARLDRLRGRGLWRVPGDRGGGPGRPRLGSAGAVGGGSSGRRRRRL